MSSEFHCPHDGCTSRYGSKSAVKRHYDLVHAGVRFPCATCGKVFMSKRSRDGHNKSVHLGMTNWRESKKLKCPHCRKTFATKSGLAIHIRNLHSVEEFPCAECNKIFVSADKLTYHVERAHKGLLFKCVDCKAAFTSRQNLLSHIQRNITCVLRSPRATSSTLQPETKRKLGELEENSVDLFMDTMKSKLKNSSPTECKHLGCTNARLGYGFVGGEKIYCIRHQHDEDGVVNLGNMNLCVYVGCAKRGHNTLVNRKHYRFCALHRDELIREGLPEGAVQQ
ncbi:unnamed protein product [Ectocarpus sp. 6 AP-2014]